MPRAASIIKAWAISPAPLFPTVKENGQKGHFRKSDSRGAGGGGRSGLLLLDKMKQLRGLLSDSLVTIVTRSPQEDIASLAHFLLL